MTSKGDGIEVENMENLSTDSSHGEDYDDLLSYGSDVQDPELSGGLVRVHEDCCRVAYRPSKAPKDSARYICLNKSSCRSQYGGRDHSILRGHHRAQPGVYEGVYGQTGKLLAAKSGTRTTASDQNRLQDEKRASDRVHASSMDGRNLGSVDESPGYSISDAEVELTAKSAEDPKSSTDKDKKLLELMSALFNRIDKLESGMEDRAATTIHRSKKATNERPSAPSILRARKDRDTEDEEPLSSVARRHRAAARKGRNGRKDTEYEEYNEEEGSVGFIDDEDDDDDDASYRTPPQRSTKKPKAKKTFSRPRLYAIACGRGGFARGGSLSRGVGEP